MDHQFPDLLDASGVQSIGGLVEDQQFWLPRQGHRYSEALFHPQRIGSLQPVPVVGQTHQFECPVNPGGLQVQQPGQEPHVLCPREMTVSGWVLDHRSDPGHEPCPGLTPRILPEQEDLSRARVEQPQEHLHGG